MTPATILELERVIGPTTRPDPNVLYEVIDGRFVESPPMGVLAGLIASQLTILLGSHAAAANLGHVVSEILFVLDAARNLRRRPDVAFVSHHRWPAGRGVEDQAAAWDVVPDLAIEVISPTDLDEEVHDKLMDYFRAGAARVWIVRPSIRHVYVYESPTRVEIFDESGTIDGGAILPGFRLPVATIFPRPASPT
jgi:Uma2 family endonuclease